MNLNIPCSLLGVHLCFREVFEIEFCDVLQLAAGSSFSGREIPIMLVSEKAFAVFEFLYSG
jgi:hypothetical protein